MVQLKVMLPLVAILALTSSAFAQNFARFDASDNFFPSLMQDVDDMLQSGALSDMADNSFVSMANSDSGSPFTEGGGSFVPIFRISSPRLIKLPSLGGMFSDDQQVTPRKSISRPMQMLSELSFPLGSGTTSKSVSVEHRNGKTIRTETTYDSDGSEHTIRSVSDDQDSDEAGPMVDSLMSDLFSMFDLANPEQQGGQFVEDGDTFDDLSTLFDDSDLLRMMNLDSEPNEQSMRRALDVKPEADRDEDPSDDSSDETRSDPVTQNEALQAVKDSLAAAGLKLAELDEHDAKDLASRIAEELKLNADDVEVTEDGKDIASDSETDVPAAASTDEDEVDEQATDADPVNVDAPLAHETPLADEDETKDSVADEQNKQDDDEQAEVNKLKNEIQAEKDEAADLKEKERNTMLAVKDEQEEGSFELLEAKDDEERAVEAEKKAEAAEKKKAADVEVLDAMEKQLQQLGVIH